VRASQRKWRQAHPDNWKRYREQHPEAVARNRQKQQQRDQKRRVVNLAKMNLVRPDAKIIAQNIGSDSV
jgi:hypothetical protein